VPLEMPFPQYPVSMRNSGVEGSVLVDFVVDKQGDVVNAHVIKSSNPEFDGPACYAITIAKFKPGIANGHTVFTHMMVPLTFKLGDGRAGFEDPGLRIAPAGSASLPAQLQYRIPPKPFLTWDPVYPFELLRKNTSGLATVTFLVDPEGHAHVEKLQNASAPEFGASACAMVEGWDFVPALRNPGEACWALLTWTQKFDPQSRLAPVFASEQRLLKELEDGGSHIVKDERDLDSPLLSRFQPSPVVPVSVKTANVRADAKIEIIVDRDGHAQLPRILSESTPDFGWAAATATARWLYTQPTRKGRHVDVLVQVPFVFSPQNPPSPGS
jgi:TonB family protein